MNPNPVSQLDHEWPLLARRLQPDLRRWQRVEPALRRFETIADVHRFFRTAIRAEADGPLLALLRLTQTDRQAGRVTLELLLPVLKRYAEFTIFDTDRYDEVWELLLFSAWERICSYPLERRPRRVLANLSLDVYHDLTAWFERRKLEQRELSFGLRPERALRGLAEDDHDEDGDSPEDEPWRPRRSNRLFERLIDRQAELDLEAAERRADGEPEDEYALLRRFVAQGVLSDEEAELIDRTRLDGISMRTVARVLQVPERTLQKRRERAERKLRAALRLQGNVANEVAKTQCCVEGKNDPNRRTATAPSGSEPLPPQAA